MTLIGALALAIWLYLVLGNGGFWRTRERDDRNLPPAPAAWPSVVAVVPARDEADVIARAVASLAAQDYPGHFRIVLVDDNSSDATAPLAHDAGGDRITVIAGQPLPSGWTGKLWAVHQGIATARAPTDAGAQSNQGDRLELWAPASAGARGDHVAPAWLWLTDADIEHAPDTLRSLVARGVQGRVLVSLMAKLRCDTLAECALIPAFVFFFQMLYPFDRVNAATGKGAAAGGCMLVRRDALETAGGIAAIRGALIDDCTFGALMKRQGRVWLGLTNRSRSIRPYDGWSAIAAMISRSAYAQLGYNPLLLAGTVIGMALVYLAPPALALLGHGAAGWLGLATWALMALSFQPMLHFYRRSPLWGIALPAIAAFYGACTLLSGWQHMRGRGGMWKGRAQAAAGR